MEKIIQQMKRGDERGFTLIELLIVIAIIAILAAIALPQFAAYRERGVRATMVTDARNLVSHAEGIFADCRRYPSQAGMTNGANNLALPVGGGSICAAGTVVVNVSSNNTVGIQEIAGAGAANGYTITVANPNAGAAGAANYSPLTLNGGGSVAPVCQWTTGTLC